MKRKWLYTMITSMLAVTLVTGCGMNNNDNNEPVDEVPTDQNIDDRDVENETDRDVEDNNLREDDNLEDDLNDDFNNDPNNRSNENNQ